jgi:ketosteroid isomerase-like protein
MSQGNVELVRASLDALQRRDMTAATKALAPGFEGRILAPGVGGKVFRGPQGAREWIADFLSAWEKADLEIREVIDAGDDLVLVRLRWRLRGRASGLETEREYSAVYELHEGKIVRYREHASRKKALEAVGLRE